MSLEPKTYTVWRSVTRAECVDVEASSPEEAVNIAQSTELHWEFDHSSESEPGPIDEVHDEMGKHVWP